jgi:hypothetical protein
MNSDEFIKICLSILNDVFEGNATHVKLQKIIDTAVIEDALPIDLSEEVLSLIFDLQTELEEIAENQDTFAGSDSMLSKKDIVSRLVQYQKVLSGF